MNCLVCGTETYDVVCDECRPAVDLYALYDAVRKAKSDCDNPILAAMAEESEDWRPESIFLRQKLIELMDDEDAVFYKILMQSETKDSDFENAAHFYLRTHDAFALRSQHILHLLLASLKIKDFIKTRSDMEWICNHEGLVFELYSDAIDYCGRTAQYDLAQELINKIREKVTVGVPCIWEKSREIQFENLSKLEEQNTKWQSKPYWPNSPEAREQLIQIYRERGLSDFVLMKTQKLDPASKDEKPKRKPTGKYANKISIKDFKAPTIVTELGDDYCLVKLGEVPGKVKCICEVTAYCVVNGEVVNEFHELVRPWKTSKANQLIAADNLNIDVEELNAQREVFQVIPELMAFVGSNTIAVDDANQLNLLTRSLRYSMYSSLENNVFLKDDSPCESSFPQSIDATPFLSRLTEVTDFDGLSFVAFDTETTGRGSWDRITEIGAVRVRDGKIVETFSMLANPGRYIPKDVQELTGITNEMVKDAPPCTDVVGQFKEFVGNDLMIGHKVDFDLRHLAYVALPANIVFENEYFDTLAFARRLASAQGWKNNKLGYLAEQLGVELNDAHRAQADAQATAGIYLKMRELIK